MQLASRLQPPFVMYENVRALRASSNEPSSGKESDLHTLVKAMNRIGYICSYGVFAAASYGFPQRRGRFYILCFRVSEEATGCTSEADSSTFLGQLGEGFKLPRWCMQVNGWMQSLVIDQPLHMSRFLLPRGDPLLRSWAEAVPGSSMVENTNAPKAKTKGQGGGSKTYEVDHSQQFEAASLPWPPSFSSFFVAKTRHVSARMQQLVFYHENVSIPRMLDGGKMFFCDLNFSMAWTRVTSDQVPCLVGSSRIWVFGRDVGAVQVTCDLDEIHRSDLSPVEALSLQGMPVLFQDVDWISKEPPREIMDMAGDAFNGGVVAACLIAMIGAPPMATILDVAGAPVCGSDSSSADEEPEAESGAASEPLVERSQLFGSP